MIAGHFLTDSFLIKTAEAATQTSATDTEYVPGRLVVTPPQATAQLGHPFTLAVAASGVKQFAISQHSMQPRPGYSVSETEIVDVPNGNASSLTFTPSVFGPVSLSIQAEFEDGTFEIVQTTINVSVDPNDIIDLRPDANSYDREVVISKTGGGMIDPVIDVQGLKNPVDVASFMTWRLVSSTANPPLTITSDGTMTAIHPGKATVEGSFLGKTINTGVKVLQF